MALDRDMDVAYDPTSPDLRTEGDDACESQSRPRERLQYWSQDSGGQQAAARIQITPLPEEPFEPGRDSEGWRGVGGS